jgi:biotin carboxylase
VSAAANRPRLVVVYGHRSLDVLQIFGGAKGWCDVVWLVDRDDPAATSVRPLLERTGTVVDRLGDSAEVAAGELVGLAPDGLATFYDTGMEHVAGIAAALELPFHSPRAALCLEDKYEQREALRAAGLPTPAVVRLPPGASSPEVQRLAGEVGYPAVLKPVRASGSWHTFPIRDAHELDSIWERLSAGPQEPLILEQYLPDGDSMPGGFEADYVSVETVASAGELTHVAVTGRFPVVQPFRETGFFIPSTISGDALGGVLEVAERALGAVGFMVGVAHTEVKLTSEGPRVIEINGRIGGGVPEMLDLTTGVDLVKVAMLAALGMPLGIEAMPATDGIGYRFFYQPPETARRVVRIDGLEELRARPGARSIRLHRPAGTELDTAEGTRSYLFAVVGKARDLDELRAADEFLRTGIAVEYEHAGAGP